MSEKEQFDSNLNMKITTDAGYIHVKGVCKVFEIKKLDKYHDLYIKSNALLSIDAFENCRKICLEIYQNWLAWQPVLKKKQNRIIIIVWFWYAINDWKGIKGGVCHSINRYAKANNNTLNITVKIKSCHILNFGM